MKLGKDAHCSNAKALSELLKRAAAYMPHSSGQEAASLPTSEEDRALLMRFINKLGTGKET